MRIQERYISEAENAKKPDMSKTVITNEAYSFLEAITELTDAIDTLRRNL
jgi:hypothetical protein